MKKGTMYVAGLMILIGIFISGVVFAQGINTKDRSLVAYWSFDEEKIEETDKGYRVIDSSLYGNDGKSTGCKVVKGVFGNALQFNGKTDYIDFPVPRPVNLTFIDKMTVMLWINCGKKIKKGEPAPLVIGKNGFYSGWRINQIYWIINGFQFQIGGRGEDRVAKPTHASGWGPQKPRSWIHLACTFDKNLPGKNITIYVNGECIGVTGKKEYSFAKDKKDDVVVTNPKYPITVGGNGRAGDGWFKGKMDELVLYNRCLSEKEVKADYERGKTRAEKLGSDKNAWLDEI